jgi:trehalose/maltose transport system substrate-binding protein
MRAPWRARLAAGLALASLAGACGGTTGGTGPAQLNWYIFNPSASIFEDAAKACSGQSHGDYHIKVNYLPATADGQRQQMARRLAAEDSSLDILGLDVTWTPEFAEAKWIAPWPAQDAADVKRGTLPTMIDTATWQGQLYSAPFNTNTQLLWYRKDLVPNPPRTWDEMIGMAEQLAGQNKPHYVEIQGAQYEGYVVWFNTMVTSAGGRILTPDGSHVALGPAAVTALQTMQRLATSVAADPSLANQREDPNRLAFESGSAAFELNYPFVYPSAKSNVPDLAKDMAWAPYPSLIPGQPSHPTIGGIDLAVSAYSNHRSQAFHAVQCLRSPENQVTNAIVGGLPPVDEAIYQDPPQKFVQAYPFYQAIYESLQRASVRPKTPAYQSVSITIADALSPPADRKPRQDVDRLRSQIGDALQSKGLIP